MDPSFRVGVSACLLGHKVRYDGGHKLDRFIRDTLGRYFTLVPVCPEAECGLGIPREAMRLEGDAETPRLVTIRSRIDLTERMQQWCRQKVRELAAMDLCGVIFKKDSPSSGMTRVKVYGPKGMPRRNGVGLFARAFMDHFPLVPVQDEGRLHDPVLREMFIEQVFAFRRWRELRSRYRGIGDLVDFHSRHKLQLMAHSPEHYRKLGKLVAGAKGKAPASVLERYEQMFVQALRRKATVKKNANVLQHIMGYFKKVLTPDEKQEMLEIIDQYRRQLVPLIVPVTLASHYVRKYRQPYLQQQVYLHPHPLDLKLRNHV